MFSFGFLTLDIIIVLAIFIGSVFLSFTKGEYILARFLLTFYPATLFFLYFPYIDLDTAISQVITYVVIFAGFYFLLKKNFTTGRSYKTSKRLFDSIILGLSTVVTIMTIYYHVIPLDTLWRVSLPFSQYLTSIVPFGVWMLVPIIALTFTHKHNA
ncbi:MAG: hypothetical protein WC087_03640 [Candidatus Paceibacterota bacterium]